MAVVNPQGGQALPEPFLAPVPKYTNRILKQRTEIVAANTMKTTSKTINTKTKIKPESAQSTIEATTNAVLAILTDFFNRQFNRLAKQIVLENFAAYAKPSPGGSGNQLMRRPVPNGATKALRNPRPRNSRLTGKYFGNPDEFERSPTPLMSQLQSTIRQVLALTDAERIQLYNGDLRLHSYTHDTYKWYATAGRRVTGTTPIRRFFADLEGAVTWIETVRERSVNNNLKGNIPLGGAKRGEFAMGWQSRDACAALRLRHDLPDKSNTPKPIRPANAWTAERRAKLAATQKAKRAFHSVDPRRQQERASTADVLAGAYNPPMPGNNLATAVESGSTAALAETANHNSQDAGLANPMATTRRC